MALFIDMLGKDLKTGDNVLFAHEKHLQIGKIIYLGKYGTISRIETTYAEIQYDESYSNAIHSKMCQQLIKL
jgi:hypothetical protein